MRLGVVGIATSHTSNPENARQSASAGAENGAEVSIELYGTKEKTICLLPLESVDHVSRIKVK